MSIDLSYPLVTSMGQHDPLDGLSTYSELQAAAMDFKDISLPDLRDEIADMVDICQGMATDLVTGDPLGIGGLLSDASRIVQLMIHSDFMYSDILEEVMDSANLGMDSFSKGRTLEYPAEYRLAFRELGLSIGLSGVKKLPKWMGKMPDLLHHKSQLDRRVEALVGYMPFREKIEQFWMNDKNREAASWVEHREINMVMLATSLAPDGFLVVFDKCSY